MNIQELLPIFVLTLVLLQLFILVWLYRIQSHYNNLTKGASKKDLLSALNLFIAKSENNQNALDQLKSVVEKEIKQNRDHLQRIGFKRFNPFTDTGGNQSFILSVLDENGDGIVISSLHSRENTRVYAKRVIKGSSEDQVLSKEELQVIKESLK